MTKANQETKLAYEAKILELTASLAAAQEENRTASELEDLLGKEEEKVKEKAERNLELIMQINDLKKEIILFFNWHIL